MVCERRAALAGYVLAGGGSYHKAAEQDAGSRSLM